MATPMQDPPDTVTAADLDLVDRLDRERLTYAGERKGTEAFMALQGLGIDLLPRLARALLAAIGDPEAYAYQQGRAASRREATDRLRQRALDLDAKAEKHERECARVGVGSAVAPEWRAQANALRAAAVDIESAP